MDTKIYANKGLFDMARIKKADAKEAKESKDIKKFDIKDLVKFSEEAKEMRKQTLLVGIFKNPNSDISTENEAKQHSLATMIKSLRKQRTSIKSNIFHSMPDKQKALRGQMDIIDNQLSTLELKQLELMRKEAGI